MNREEQGPTLVFRQLIIVLTEKNVVDCLQLIVAGQIQEIPEFSVYVLLTAGACQGLQAPDFCVC